MTISWGTLFLLIGAFIAFCLAIQVFDLVEKSIRVDWLCIFFFILGVMLQGAVLFVIKKGTVVQG